MIDRLAGSSRTVVARRTGTEHLRVIHLRDWLPHTGGMTCLTGTAGLNVRHVLAGGIHAVVATGTTAAHTGMIKTCRTPGQRTVTGAALAGCAHMGRRFAGGDRTVVARGTSTDDLRVIHLARWLPQSCAMTTFAGIA